MSGYSRIHRKIPLILGVGLICFPGVLNAQTAAEKVRAEERALAVERARAEELARAKVLRERLEERRQLTKQERLERLAEAEFRIQQELARTKEERLQFTDQERLRRLAEAESRIQQEVARDKGLQESRARELERIGQERTREVEARVRAVQKARVRAQEELQRAQQVMVQVRSRVRLGVSLDGTQGEEYDGLGARVTGTLDESPAEEAGLLEGDIITHLNGQSLLDPIPQEDEAGFDDEFSIPVQRLRALAAELEAGEDVEVRYLRDGSPQTISFQTAEMDEPTITVVRGGEGGERAFRILRSPGGEAVFRVGPDRGGEAVYRIRPERGGVWTFEGPDKELVEIQLSRIKELEEMGELKALAELEDLKVHLKDLQVDMQGLDDVRRNLVIRRGPGSERESWTLRGEEGSPLVYALARTSAGLGLKLAEMNPGLAEYFSADEGLLVLDVQEDSSLGLAPGDVILSIDGRSIEDQRDVMRILGSYEKDEAVSFTVIRKGRETRVEGRIG